jgi:hypothetical protein
VATSFERPVGKECILAGLTYKTLEQHATPESKAEGRKDEGCRMKKKQLGISFILPPCGLHPFILSSGLL